MKKLDMLSDRQHRILVIFFAVLFAFATLLLVVTMRTGAQTQSGTITGEWTAHLSKKRPDQLQIMFIRRSENGGVTNMSGNAIALSAFQGLNPSAISSAKTDVNFMLTREAGTFTFEGFFREGRGTGFWTFTRSEPFATMMKGRGYGYLNDEEMLRAAFHNLTGKYIDELKSAGYTDLDFKQLTRAAGHDITLAYIRELETAGYPGLKMDELIRAQNHDVNAAFIRDVKAMGFEKQPLDKLIRMHNHDITTEFVNRMKAAGFQNLSIDTLIRLHNHDVTPEFVNEIKAEGYPDLSPETAIRLKNHDVTRDIIRRAKAQGHTNATLEDIIGLKNRGTVK
ncbi:MAG TPA: hypothetical protein VNA17_07455 [Pyrinomonadaceae bacterium]|nr:hypothetical protein [Pyrinomonadaceae bacterium]